MKKRYNKGFVAIDIVISIIAITIFSGLIISLMYNNFIENEKVRRKTLAIIYLTETLEKIGIEEYDEITQENALNLIPDNLEEDKYNMDIVVISDLNLSQDSEDERIIKKVQITITYKVGNKDYQCSMERVKIKE